MARMSPPPPPHRSAAQTDSDPHALAQQAISANLALRAVVYIPFAIFQQGVQGFESLSKKPVRLV